MDKMPWDDTQVKVMGQSPQTFQAGESGKVPNSTVPNVSPEEPMPWDKAGVVLPSSTTQQTPGLPGISKQNSILDYAMAPGKGALEQAGHTVDIVANKPSQVAPQQSLYGMNTPQTDPFYGMEYKGHQLDEKLSSASKALDIGKPKDQLEAALRGAGAPLGDPVTYAFGPAAAVSSIAGNAVTAWRNAADPDSPVTNNVLGLAAGLATPTAANMTFRKGNSLTQAWEDTGVPPASAAGIGEGKSFNKTIRGFRESPFSNAVNERELKGRTALTEKVNSQADSLGFSQTKAEAGQNVKDSLGFPSKAPGASGWINDTERDLSRRELDLNRKVDPSTTLVDTTGLVKDLQTALRPPGGASGYSDPGVEKFLGNLDSSLKSYGMGAAGYLPLSAIEYVKRNVIGDKMKDAIFGSSDISQRNLQIIWGKLSDVEKSAYAGTPYAAEKDQLLNDWRQFFQNRDSIKGLIDKNISSGKSLDQLLNERTRDGEKLNKVFDLIPDSRGEVASYYLRQMGKDVTGEFNADRFFKEWNNPRRISPEAREALFGDVDGDIPKIYDQLAKVAEEQARSEKAKNASGTGGTNEFFRVVRSFTNNIAQYGVLPGGIAGAAAYGQTNDLNESSAIAGTAAIVGYGASMTFGPKLFTNPAFVRFLAKDPPMERVPALLRAFAIEHPQLATEVTALQNYVNGVNTGIVNQEDRPKTPILNTGEYIKDKSEKAGSYIKKKLGFAEGGPVQYDTTLTPQEELQFQIWKMKNAPNDSGEDYDLRGAFKAGLSPAENGHWSDQFKKPNHETFSNESMYSKQNPDLPAGSWDGDRFIPPAHYAMGGPANENEMQGRSGSLIDLFMGSHMPMGGGGAGGRGKSYDYYKMQQSATPNENVGFISKQTPKDVITGKTSDNSTAWDTNFQPPEGMQRIPGNNSNEQLVPQEWQDMSDFAHGSFFNGFAEGGAVNLFEETEGIDPNPHATFMESDGGNKAILDYVFPGWQRGAMPDVPELPWHQRIVPNTVNNQVDREAEIDPKERFTDPRFEKQGTAPWKQENSPVYPQQSFEDAVNERQPSYAEGGQVKRYYTLDEMRQFAANAGFKGPAINTMAAIGMAESKGDSQAYNGKGENSYGLTQINADAHGPKAKGALNPQTAFNLAFDISHGGTNFRPWTMYTNGQYQQYLNGGSGGTMLANKMQVPTSVSNKTKQPTEPTQSGSNQLDNQDQPSSILQQFVSENNSPNEEEESTIKKQKLAQSHIDEVPWADPLTKYAIKGIWENANI